MIELMHRIAIRAPRARVWQVLAEVTAWPDWTPTMTGVEPLAGHALEVGAAFRVRQPNLPAAVWRVESVEPEHSFRWTSTGVGHRVDADHAIAPRGADCDVLLRVRFQGILGVVGGYLTRRLTQRYLRIEAEGLRARCEQVRTSFASRSS